MRGRAAWRRWLVALALGWVACGVLMVGLVEGVRAWAEAGGQARDAAWLEALVQGAPVAVNQALWMNLPGYAFFSIPILAVAAVWFVRTGRPLWALSMLASYFLVAVVIGLGWQLWDRPRPELVLGGALVPGFHSFPSGHVAQAIPVYGLLVYAWVHRSQRWGEHLLAWGGFGTQAGAAAPEPMPITGQGRRLSQVERASVEPGSSKARYG